jgi:hypothetical protein
MRRPTSLKLCYSLKPNAGRHQLLLAIPPPFGVEGPKNPIGCRGHHPINVPRNARIPYACHFFWLGPGLSQAPQPQGRGRRPTLLWREDVTFGEKLAYAKVAAWNADPALWAILYPTGNGRWIADLIGSQEDARQHLSLLRRIFRRSQIHNIDRVPRS